MNELISAVRELQAASLAYEAARKEAGIAAGNWLMQETEENKAAYDKACNAAGSAAMRANKAQSCLRRHLPCQLEAR